MAVKKAVCHYNKGVHGMKNIGIIIGSNRPNRISFDIATWVQKNLISSQFQTNLIDLAKVNLPWLAEPEIPAKGHYTLETTQKWRDLINQYDGFIIVYPQYNWGYPAILKNALDSLYSEWQGKPISTVVFGSHGGFQADIALSLILQGLHMNKLPINLSISINDDMFSNHSFINIDDALAKYRPDVQQLGVCFENVLNNELL